MDKFYFMLKEYLKTALRNLQRNKFHAVINVVGLAVGFAAVILIFLFVFTEFTYDHFHKNKDYLYRVSVKRWREGKLDGDGPQFTPPLGPAMAQSFPEIKNFARLSTERVAYIAYDNREPVKVVDIHHADGSVFDLFSFPLRDGDPKTALVQPFTMVVAEKTAKKLFGNELAVGKVVRLDNKQDYMVTGVAKDPPVNSSITFNALISFNTLYKTPNVFLDWDGGNQYITYVELNKDADPKIVNAKLPALLWTNINEKYAKAGARLEAYLQPIKKVHLFYEENSASLRSNMYVFSIIALFILLIACVNFINLTTARASKRAKEVGVRKVLGASRKRLIQQFLTEAMLVSLFALIIALFIVAVSRQLYEQVLGKPLFVPASLGFNLASAIVLLFLLVVIGVGVYPAFYLSRFKTIPTLKGWLTRDGKPFLRNLLVTTQFSISIALIASTIIIFQQQQFIKNKSLGFTKDNIVILPLVGEEAQKNYVLLKDQLNQLPEIKSLSASSDVPHRGFTTNGYKPQGVENFMQIHVVDVDQDFLKTYDIPLLAGRNFSKERPSDNDGYMINETLAKMLNWKDPVGRKILRNGEHLVIGVVKDFHFASLRDNIEPLIITNKPWNDQFDFLAIHYNSQHTQTLLNEIKQRWKKSMPSTPFDYWFLNDSFNQLYQSERHFEHGFLYSSVLAIILAILGMLGLVTFSVERRTKEIGVRKVLGASSFSVAKLLSRDFLRLILVANVIAWPVAWVFMSKWLQEFANRVQLSVWVFFLAGIVALFVALLTIGFQAIKAALANPVKSLRTE
jgi:putative ABC transport system permease protein